MSLSLHHMLALRQSLPPPPIDTPEAAEGRDMAAALHFSDLEPIGDLECHLAIQHVAACAQALDAMRQINAPDATPKVARQCRSQAATMMRASQTALRVLRAEQACRSRARLDTAQPDLAQSHQHPATPPAQPRQPAPPAAPNPLVAAEQYARQSPTRAARIRRAGGVPPDAGFEVPPHVVQALVSGTSKHLRRLDRLAV